MIIFHTNTVYHLSLDVFLKQFSATAYTYMYIVMTVSSSFVGFWSYNIDLDHLYNKNMFETTKSQINVAYKKMIGEMLQQYKVPQCFCTFVVILF